MIQDEEVHLTSQEMGERFDLLARNAKEYALFLVGLGGTSALLEFWGGTHFRIPIR